MDELEFVRSCVRADKQAWDEFVERYSRLIYSYIYSIINSFAPNTLAKSNVDDLFQEIFLLLTKDNFRKLSSFKGKNGCSLASWLKTVVVNYTISYLRKARPIESLEEENDEGLILKDILIADSTPVTERLINKEMIRGLKDCIKELDREDKFFLELHINKGLLLEELKRLLKVSRGAIDMQKTRIIERLRNCFRHKGFLLDS